MQVQAIKEFKTRYGTITRGTPLRVRTLKSPIDLNPKYQIISGKHSGEFIPREHFIELANIKLYTEKEWTDRENQYVDSLEEERKKVSELQSQIDEIFEPLEQIWKLASVSSQVSEMLNAWLNKEYKGDEKTDRDNFSIKLTKFIQEKLV